MIPEGTKFSRAVSKELTPILKGWYNVNEKVKLYKKLKVDNYKPHAFINTQHTQQNPTKRKQHPTKRIGLFLRKIFGGLAYSERKVWVTLW